MLEDLFGRPAAPEGSPLILFVCTGNICRSPLAEKLLRERLEQFDPTNRIEVASAGLHAVVGAPMEPEPAAIGERHGGVMAHEARQLTAAIARRASVILTMTKAQRAELSQEFPFALKRTFTLVEFVRLLAEVPDKVAPPSAQNGRTLFDTSLDASRYRGSVVAHPTDDIEDPYRRSAETHERVGERIVTLADELAAQLTGKSGGTAQDAGPPTAR
ncbi:low molecular weight phosphatase family protein [Herbiconiux sp. CPCC 205716]|uniref:Low molecular weight phosphatase family protein n=1 Tax=Herbiconiux gentiana TaxID=2970912 RepID=A0ABT2GC04_9MICO|nr:low molecular weight phosphatase family protein [Herbiconiux gentiana]MCS5713733.1 low molecular weight phosphatase family protein [Herbiconiux gentiana]